MARGPMGRGMHGGAAGESAKDFKGTIKKLFRYMGAFKVHMLFVAVFAICGTIFNIAGPKILGQATTEILAWSVLFPAEAAWISAGLARFF